MALVLIIGAGKGIGMDLTRLHLDNGDLVLAVSRNTEKLAAILGFNANLKIVKLDFANLLQQKELMAELLNWPIPEIIYYNAAFLKNKAFETLESSEIEKMVQTNFLSYVYFSQSVLKKYKQGIHFVAISSMGGFQGSAKFPGLSLYSSTKAALAVFMESLAVEFPLHRFNTLALGAVNTEMLSEAFPGYQAPVNSDKMAEFIYWFGKNGQHFFQGKIIPVALSTP